MFDIGWQELFLIAVVTILVVGPRELPRVLRTVVAALRKVRGLANDFQRGMDELAREADLDDIRKDLEKSADLDLESKLKDEIDPTGEITNSMRQLENEMESTGVETDADLAASEETNTASGYEIEKRVRHLLMEENVEEAKMPLLDHLVELRQRLLYSVGGFLVCFIGAFFFAADIFNFLVQPLADLWQGEDSWRLIYTALHEKFFTDAESRVLYRRVRCISFDCRIRYGCLLRLACTSRRREPLHHF